MSKSIEEFLLAKRRSDCRVCAFSPALRKQINEARVNSRVRVVDILAWLATRGIKITQAEWRKHYRGLHEGEVAQVHKGRNG